MLRVKIFFASNTGTLEEQINAWLREYCGTMIQHIQQMVSINITGAVSVLVLYED